MNISCNLINILSKQSLKDKETQNWTDLFCFANWVQNKDSLSLFSIALGAFIRRNTVCVYMVYIGIQGISMYKTMNLLHFYLQFIFFRYWDLGWSSPGWFLTSEKKGNIIINFFFTLSKQALVFMTD